VRNVLHCALTKVLESCSISSKFGDIIHCGDGKERIIFFAINSLSADLDEAWKLTLTRGVRSTNGVCPICIVPKDEQHDISKCWPLRNTRHATEIVREAETIASQPRSKTRAEKLLREHGYYLITVSHSFLVWFFQRDLLIVVHRMRSGISEMEIHTMHCPMITYILMTSER
jgi:hypothetical protein